MRPPGCGRIAGGWAWRGPRLDRADRGAPRQVGSGFRPGRAPDLLVAARGAEAEAWPGANPASAMNFPASLRVLGLFLGSLSAALAADYPVQPVPFTDVRLTQGFWRERQEVNRTVTVPFALKQCEDSGRLRNFDLAADTMHRRAAGEKGFQHNPPTQYP